MNINSELSKTGKPFHKVKKLQPQRDMPPINLIVILGMYKGLGKRIGYFKALRVFCRAWLWDMFFHRPKWHPEYFDFKNDEEEHIFKETFDTDVIYQVALFNDLKRRFGEKQGDELIGKVALTAGLRYLSKIFISIKNLVHIDQFRQLMTDYLGDGKRFEWHEKVSEDGTEVRYHFTKCAHNMIWRAYGLKGLASYVCMCDHIAFDFYMPELVFGRTHALGVGDSYCNHMFRIRTQEDTEIDEENYKDVHKAPYGTRDELRKVMNELRGKNKIL